MASLEEQQARNEVLITGASALAAGQTLGMSEEEVFTALARKQRNKQQQDDLRRAGAETQAREIQRYGRKLDQMTGMKLAETFDVRNTREIDEYGAEGFGGNQAELQEWESPLEKANAGFKNERPERRNTSADFAVRKAIREKQTPQQIEQIKANVRAREAEKQKMFDFGLNLRDTNLQGGLFPIQDAKYGPLLRQGRASINFDDGPALRDGGRAYYGYDDYMQGGGGGKIVFAGGFGPREVNEDNYVDYYGVQQDQRGGPVELEPNYKSGKRKPYKARRFERGIPMNIAPPIGAVRELQTDGNYVTVVPGQDAAVVPDRRLVEGRWVRRELAPINGKRNFRFEIERNPTADNDYLANIHGNFPQEIGNAPARVNDDAMRKLQAAVSRGEVDPAQAQVILARMERNAAAPSLRGDRMQQAEAVLARDRMYRGIIGQLTTGELEQQIQKEMRGIDREGLSDDLSTIRGREVADTSPVMQRVNPVFLQGLRKPVKGKKPDLGVQKPVFRQPFPAREANVAAAEQAIRAQQELRIANPLFGMGGLARVKGIQRANVPVFPNGFTIAPAVQGYIKDLGKARVGGGIPGDPLNRITGTNLRDVADAPGFNGIFRNREDAAAARLDDRREKYKPLAHLIATEGKRRILHVDDSGNPLGSAVRAQEAFRGAANTADTSQALNAPHNPQEWMEARKYDNYGAQRVGDMGIIDNDMAAAGGGEIRGGGGGLRQVDIQGAIANAEAKLAGVKNKKLAGAIGSSPQIRRLDDLEALRNKVKDVGRFIDVDGTVGPNGKPQVTSNPGITDILHGLNVRGKDQVELANALFQLEAGAAMPGNTTAKQAFLGGGAFPIRPEASVVAGVNDPAHGGNRLDIERAPREVQNQLRAAQFRTGGGGDRGGLIGDPNLSASDVSNLASWLNAQPKPSERKPSAISPDAAKPFIGRAVGQEKEAQGPVGPKGRGPRGRRAPGRDMQVFRGMDPVQVRKAMEDQNFNADMRDRRKKEKRGIRVLTSPTDPQRPERVARIRAMQEGNARARLRAEGKSNSNYGKINRVPVAAEGTQKLSPRPAYPPNSQETSDLTGPISRIKDLATNPKYQRGRRIAYGGAGAAAVLAGILGTRNPEEEEQY